jgi:hypothetical protein
VPRDPTQPDEHDQDAGKSTGDGEDLSRLAEWLEMTLGTRLTAFATGLTTRELVRIAHGDAVPDDEVQRRLRNLYRVASLLASREGAGGAYAWLTEPNEELGGRSPARVLHDGRSVDTLQPAMEELAERSAE